MHLRAGAQRTKLGIQYADLSSLTLHVVHWEFRRSEKVVLYPMAGTKDQIDVLSYKQETCPPPDPIMV